jgi:hypothetical protein
MLRTQRFQSNPSYKHKLVKRRDDDDDDDYDYILMVTYRGHPDYNLDVALRKAIRVQSDGSGYDFEKRQRDMTWNLGTARDVVKHRRYMEALKRIAKTVGKGKYVRVRLLTPMMQHHNARRGRGSLGL